MNNIVISENGESSIENEMAKMAIMAINITVKIISGEIINNNQGMSK